MSELEGLLKRQGEEGYRIGMQEEVRRPLSWWSWFWSWSVGRERRRPGVQEEIRILLRQSEVVHLLGVDQLGQASSWCCWEDWQHWK